MDKLTGGQQRADRTEADYRSTNSETIPDATGARVVAQARRLMIISGLTTLVAIAAVSSVIGYRVFRAGGRAGTAATQATTMLPKGARVISTALSGERIAVTLDLGGAIEMRIFDAKTLKETGRMRFMTEP